MECVKCMVPSYVVEVAIFVLPKCCNVNLHPFLYHMTTDRVHIISVTYDNDKDKKYTKFALSYNMTHIMDKYNYRAPSMGCTRHGPCAQVHGTKYMHHAPKNTCIIRASREKDRMSTVTSIMCDQE